MQAHGLGGTFTDEADLTAKKGYVVKIGAADNGVILADDNDEPYVGIVDSVPLAAAGSVGIQSHGIGRVVCGGTVTRGTLVQADAAGKIIDFVPGAGTEYYLGLALESGAANEVVRVNLTPGVHGT